MCSLVQSAYQKIRWPSPKVEATAPSTALRTAQVDENAKTTTLMQKVVDVKKTHMEAALSDKCRRYNPILIGGDIFTVGFIGLDVVRSLLPATGAAAGALGIAGSVCGLIGGAINIGVGIVCLKESIQAFRNKDKVLGLRLLLDFICSIAIGALMIMVSIAFLAGLTGITAFFAANPWLLPLLFFVVTIPLFLELAYRIKNVLMKKDLGSQMKIGQLQNLLKQKAPDWGKIEKLYTNQDNIFHLPKFKEEKETVAFLSDKMEKLQADIGVVAAIESMNLLTAIKKRNKEEAIKQAEIVKSKVAEWNRSLY
ncbi:MAG: hypothetical protein FJZ64_03880, partial [Chlamydiae bacterium]|nr:hypothetical protein [Chlamydiota bacterium]